MPMGKNNCNDLPKELPKEIAQSVRLKSSPTW